MVHGCWWGITVWEGFFLARAGMGSEDVVTCVGATALAGGGEWRETLRGGGIVDLVGWYDGGIFDGVIWDIYFAIFFPLKFLFQRVGVCLWW